MDCIFILLEYLRQALWSFASPSSSYCLLGAFSVRDLIRLGSIASVFGDGFIIEGDSSTSAVYLVGSTLSLQRDTLFRRPGSVAHDVSIGGSISVNSLVSVVKGNMSVEFRSRFGNGMSLWKIVR